MANNFRISCRRKKDSLHVRLKGDFDGTSAYQLLHVLKDHSSAYRKILVNTGSLKEVHLFGKTVFRRNLDFLNRQPCDLLFTGQKASEFAS